MASYDVARAISARPHPEAIKELTEYLDTFMVGYTLLATSRFSPRFRPLFLESNDNM